MRWETVAAMLPSLERPSVLDFLILQLEALLSSGKNAEAIGNWGWGFPRVEREISCGGGGSGPARRSFFTDGSFGSISSSHGCRDGVGSLAVCMGQVMAPGVRQERSRSAGPVTL